LNNICSTHISHAVSGINDDDLISGRPYGGSTILWRADIDAKVHSIVTNNKRICSIQVYNDEYKFLVINEYVPYKLGTTAAIFSDHDPILLSLNVDWNLFSSRPRQYSNKCLWHKASAKNPVLYKQSLKADLSAVHVLMFNLA
jgi:hypothetical protein